MWHLPPIQPNRTRGVLFHSLFDNELVLRIFTGSGKTVRVSLLAPCASALNSTESTPQLLTPRPLSTQRNARPLRTPLTPHWITDTKMLNFTDSLSAVHSKDTISVIVHYLWDTRQKCTVLLKNDAGPKVTIHWILVHVGIMGNEFADTIVKEVTTRAPDLNTIPYTDLKSY